MSSSELTSHVIGACIEVHRHLGPGLLESAYEECLVYELSARSIQYVRQQALPVVYKGISLECGYLMDIVVDNRLVIDLKSVEVLLPIHEAQLLTYLKLANISLGLLINFNVPILTRGIKRLVNNHAE